MFALRFALAGALLASRRRRDVAAIGWILSMVSARSAAMGFNRIVDARMDALSPGLMPRSRGVLSQREAVAFVVVASLGFVYAAWLNPVCLALSPVALAIVFWYSLAKRYTTWTQLFSAWRWPSRRSSWLVRQPQLGAVAARSPSGLGRRLRRVVCLPGSVRPHPRPAVDSVASVCPRRSRSRG